MDYSDAIDEILEKAARITLPGDRADIVTLARREFKTRGACGANLIDPMEQILRACLREWSPEQKREIWQSTETGMASEAGLDDEFPESIDMELKEELLFYLIEELAPNERHDDSEIDDDEGDW